jgi:hypothetical protein
LARLSGPPVAIRHPFPRRATSPQRPGMAAAWGGPVSIPGYA